MQTSLLSARPVMGLGMSQPCLQPRQMLAVLTTNISATPASYVPSSSYVLADLSKQELRCHPLMG